jgi:hypothetical protein
VTPPGASAIEGVSRYLNNWKQLQLATTRLSLRRQRQRAGMTRTLKLQPYLLYILLRIVAFKAAAPFSS